MPIASRATRAPLAAPITACDVVARPYRPSAASSRSPATSSSSVSPRPDGASRRPAGEHAPARPGRASATPAVSSRTLTRSTIRASQGPATSVRSKPRLPAQQVVQCASPIMPSDTIRGQTSCPQHIDWRVSTGQSVRACATRIAVDVGGTFTDLVLSDEETGRIVIGKVPTVPDAPDEGVLGVLGSALDAADVESSEYFLHGTTVGLNALLENRGAVVGLLCTRGFRDVLEVRRGDRGDPYDLFWHAAAAAGAAAPAPARSGGRMRADGVEHAPFEPDDVAAAAARFAEHGVTAVAIAFMNAYANPAHELEAERLLREAGLRRRHLAVAPGLGRVPRVRAHLHHRDRRLRPPPARLLPAPGSSTGLGGTRLRRRLHDHALGRRRDDVRRGRGPAVRDDHVRPGRRRPGGGRAGPRARTLRHAIAADVGGTSFDTCLIDDGRPPVLYQGEVVGLPIQTPWVDVRSIGAGGGSIAYVDSGGLLRVGPQSAGADPGPACYGRGGDAADRHRRGARPGHDPGRRRSPARCRSTASRPSARSRRLAEPLGFDSVTEVACGVIRIAAAQMADAIRSVTIERGRDPREATLVAFGGAGPLFGTLLADELGRPHRGRPAARRQLLGLGPARRRPRPQRLADAGHALSPRTASTAAGGIAGELFAELDARGSGDGAAEHFARCTWTCATSARSTR